MIIFVIHVIIIIIILIIMLLIIHCTITRDTFSYFIESPNAIIIMYIRRKHLLYHYLIIMLSSSHRNALHFLPNPLKVYAIIIIFVIHSIIAHPNHQHYLHSGIALRPPALSSLAIVFFGFVIHSEIALRSPALSSPAIVFLLTDTQWRALAESPALFWVGDLIFIIFLS